MLRRVICSNILRLNLLMGKWMNITIVDHAGVLTTQRSSTNSSNLFHSTLDLELGQAALVSR